MSDYQPNRWYAIKDQSLAAYARNAGFDLTVYSQYSRSSRAELRRCAIAEAVKAIALKCEEQGFGIDDIAHGVYVIALSDPLSILYPKHRSQVIYIGMGNIRYRLESHFKRTLFKLMLDLAGTNFDLYLALSLPRFSGHLRLWRDARPERSPGWPHDTRQSSASGRWS